MSHGDSSKWAWLYRLADKTPMDVAGPVLISAILLIISPSIISTLDGNSNAVYLYLGMLLFLVIVTGTSILLYAVSKYHERERNSKLESIRKMNVVDEDRTDLVIKQEIQEAVASMKETQNE